MKEYKDLLDQIWTTRISRVNAEKRLKEKESFFQAVNIYYSCATIIFSILSLLEDNKNLSLITVFMTVSLLIVILYLNGQNYLEHARKYRKNYTELQKLEFELKYIGNSNEEIERIFTEYCDLLDSSSNHISFDYYKTVYHSSGEYKERRWIGGVKWLYWYNVIYRGLLKICVVLLPILLWYICRWKCGR